MGKIRNGRSPSVELGLGWFGGEISRRAHPASLNECDYMQPCCALMEPRVSCMKLPLDSCMQHSCEGVDVGAWVLLEVTAGGDEGREV